MSLTRCLRGSLACCCRRQQSLSQTRCFASLMNQRNKESPPRNHSCLKDSSIVFCNNKDLRSSFERHYSAERKWDWKLTKFNSIVLDATVILNSTTNREQFLLDLDGASAFPVFYSFELGIKE